MEKLLIRVPDSMSDIVASSLMELAKEIGCEAMCHTDCANQEQPGSQQYSYYLTKATESREIAYQLRQIVKQLRKE